MADWTSDERRQLRGRLHTSGYNGGKAFTYSTSEADDAPDTLDWRLYGAVTPVKDQSVCGSCWSFGTVGTLEGTLFLQTGELIRYNTPSRELVFHDNCILLMHSYYCIISSGCRSNR